MIKRLASHAVSDALSQFPAVALLGPRQCGKTTLAKSFSKVYFDLEQDADRLRVDLEWPALCRQKDLVILDEAQAYPAIFQRLRGAIDADRKKNRRFMILGSVAPALMKNVSESLAGRLAIRELTPFLLGEIPAKSMDALWLRGGFPDGGILRPKRFPLWQKDYLTLLAQRDLPAWGLPAKPQMTMRFLKMLGASHAQIWNASSIGSSLGISYHTANSYLEYLQNAYLVTVLEPFFKNIGKRLVKSPKVYWNDSGLFHSMMGVDSQRTLLDQPFAGASWEGFCIFQILGALKSYGRVFEPYFLRTSDGLEVDLLLFLKNKKIALEFKLTTSPSNADFDKLERASKPADVSETWLVSRTPRIAGGHGRLSTNLPNAIERLLAF